MGGWVLSEKAFIKIIEPLLKKKDYKSALKLAEKEAKKNPQNPFAWYAKGTSLLNLKKYKNAIDAFQTFVENNRSNKIWGFSYLGDCYKGLKDYSKAILNYKKALELDPKYKNALLALEFCYRQLNDVDNAIKANESIVKYYPREPWPWYWLCFLHLKKNDLKQALVYVQKAIRYKSKFVKLEAFTKAIMDAYNEISKHKQGINAMKEVEFSEFGSASLRLRDKGLTSFNEIIDLDYVQPIIFTLILDDNQLQTLAFSNEFTILNWLQVNDNKISEITGLEYLPALKNLRLNGNVIKEITNLEQATSLESLQLNDNEIQRIGGLDSLRNLKFLFLNDNQIQKFEGLSKLSNLKTLSISNNKIEIVNGLDSLFNLERLFLANNTISDISDINKLRNLIVLDLSNNLIKNVSSIDNLSKLSILNLANNQIPTIKTLGKLSSLTKLDLSNNNLSTFDNLEFYPKLNQLNLENNPALPEFFAILYIDEKAIQKIRKYSGLSNEELQLAAQKEIQLMKEKERLEQEKRKLKEAKLKEKYKREAFLGSAITSGYGAKQKLNVQLNALLELNESNRCLYCYSEITKEADFTNACASTIDKLLTDTKKALPRIAPDENRYTEREITYEVTNRRNDIYDRPGTTTRTEIIREYFKRTIEAFEPDHFPKLPGALCKSCSDDFIRKTIKIFKRLQRKANNKKLFYLEAIDVRRNAHFDYMKLFESMINKTR